MGQPRQSLPRAERGVPPVTFEIESALFSTAQQDTVHATFAPLHYEPGYAYPLLVWLHGPLADERQLLRIMPLVSMRNYVAVAPRGVSLAPQAGRIAAPSEESVYGWSDEEHGLQQAEQRIFDSIELTFRRFNIDPRRIFLAGFDTGGTMAFRVAMNHPYKFAGCSRWVDACRPAALRSAACRRPGSWRSSWPRAAAARSIASTRSAMTFAFCTPRGCRLPCGSIRAAMRFRRKCSPTSIAGSSSKSRRPRRTPRPWRRGKIRNPKFEIRNKSEIRNKFKTEIAKVQARPGAGIGGLGVWISFFRFRISNLFRISDFGFRICSLPLTAEITLRLLTPEASPQTCIDTCADFRVHSPRRIPVLRCACRGAE